MALELQLREPSTIPIEVDSILPETLVGLSTSEIERREILVGNTRRSLAERFVVRGTAADESIVWSGDLSHVHRIGEKMSRGTMTVEGNAGGHVANQASGGSLHITGNVGVWAAAEMQGGLLRVDGHAGNLVGAAYRGSVRGMRGGTVLIQGNAGREVGHAMRRGVIAICGSCESLVGMNMLAGSICVAGRLGEQPGWGMKRGTILTLSDVPVMPLTFRGAWHDRPLAIVMLLRELYALGMTTFGLSDRWNCDLYHGDVLAGGRGELVVARRP